MPELGYKPVNQYLPPRPRGTTALGAAARLQTIVHRYGRRLAWLDPTVSCRIDQIVQSRAVSHRIHDVMRRGLWLVGLGSVPLRAPVGLAAARPGVRCGVDPPRAWRRQRRPPVLDVSSRASRAGVACVFAMAVASWLSREGRGLGGDLRSERRLRHRLGRVPDYDRPVGAERASELRRRGGYRDLHRLHLPLAEADFRHGATAGSLRTIWACSAMTGALAARPRSRRCSAMS